MKKPDPQIGQIIRFDYLWRDEHERGRMEGTKERPCAVVVARKQTGDEPYQVLLAPITHSPPQDMRGAIEMPSQFNKITGLDQERSWVVTSEVNHVSWNDPGIVPAKRDQWLYGMLPRGIAQKAVQNVTERMNERELNVVDRAQAEQQPLTREQEKMLERQERLRQQGLGAPENGKEGPDQGNDRGEH